MLPQGIGQPLIDYNGQVQQPATNSVSGLGLDLNTVIGTLKEQVGSISSSENTIDNAISGAIQSQRLAAEQNAQAINSAYGRESSYLFDKLQNERTAMLERSRGQAVSGSAVLIVDKEIDKNLRDLESRKNELIMQGNADAADKISQLQVQQITMKMDLKQKHYANLLGLADLQSSLAKQQADERENARRATMEKANYDLEVQRQKAYESKSAAELANEVIRLNIMQQEVNLKKLEVGRNDNNKPLSLSSIPGSPGWVNAEMQGTFTSQINVELDSIRNNKNTTEAEKQAAMALVYVKYRGLLAPGIVSDDALRTTVFGPKASDAYAPENTNYADMYLPGVYSHSTPAFGTKPNSATPSVDKKFTPTMSIESMNKILGAK